MTVKSLGRIVAALCYFVFYSVCILLIGSVLFGCLFVILGLIWTDYSPQELLHKGLSVGFRYAGVWAGGSALVLTVIRLARKG